MNSVLVHMKSISKDILFSEIKLIETDDINININYKYLILGVYVMCQKKMIHDRFLIKIFKYSKITKYYN